LNTLIPLTFVQRPPDPTELVFWCAIGFCAGIWLFYSGFRMLQRRRLILDTPLSKIRSASMGIVEISGLATGPYTLTAPITGRECFYCRTQIWEWKQKGRSKGWVSAASQCIYIPFFVDDNTGRLLVDPRDADLDLHCDFKEEFNTSFFSSADIAPGSVNAFLSRHGIVTSNKLKVEEYCIKPKNSLFILGTLAENPGVEVTPEATIEAVADSRSHVSLLSVQSIAFAAGSATNELGTRLKAARAAAGATSAYNQAIHPPPKIDPAIFKTPQQQKAAAALLNAGIANPSAWAAAGVPWPTPHVAQPVSKSLNVDDPDRRPPVVLMKGENNKTFLISWRGQSELARSLGWKCTLMIWGGPALALLSLYLLFAVLGWISFQ
jgi:hypothetical protein